jgi:prepilin signal peptidase PulO-like enzyme (type II secretory pathway)
MGSRKAKAREPGRCKSLCERGPPHRRPLAAVARAGPTADRGPTRGYEGGAASSAFGERAVVAATELLLDVRAVALVAGLAVAAGADLRTREVSDGLWQLLAGLALAFGAIEFEPRGALPLILWLVVGAFAIEHLLPWDEALGERHADKVLVIELALYGVVVGIVAGAAYRWGIGPSTVPIEVVGALATVVGARALFEAGVLYGGADAKALIVAGVLLPLFAAPVLYAPPGTASALGFLPFSVTLLTNAALLSIAVPLFLAARNVARGEFSFPRGFTTYTLPVDELPHRFVWVRDPALGEDTLADDSETSEEDIARRTELAETLRRRGVARVWVSPQLPFLALMAAGAFAGLLVGNLLLDVIVRL